MEKTYKKPALTEVSTYKAGVVANSIPSAAVAAAFIVLAIAAA